MQTTLNVHHQSNEVRFNNLDAKVQHSINEIQPLQRLIGALNNEGLDIHTHIRVSQTNNITTPTIQPHHLTQASNHSASIAVDPVNIPLMNPEVPQYRMQSWVQTVVQLWEEYDKGIASTIGQLRGPSIRGLDDRYGSRWRRLEAHRKPYWRRKFIWQAVIAASNDLNISPEQVAERMDLWRSQGRESSISLKKLNDMLSAVVNNQKPPLWGPNHIELLEYA